MSSTVKSTKGAHLGRIIRLAGSTFAGAAIAGVTSLPTNEKTAVVAAFVAAVETTYRTVVPASDQPIVTRIMANLLGLLAKSQAGPSATAKQ